MAENDANRGKRRVSHEPVVRAISLKTEMSGIHPNFDYAWLFVSSAHFFHLVSTG